MGKIGRGLQGLGNPFMLHKLGAIIKGERLHPLFDGAEKADDGL